MQTYTIDIRPRRQATFPQELLGRVGVDVGDKLIAEIKDNLIVLKPRKQAAMDALKQLQKAFQESGIPEKEMQDNLKKIRQEIYDKRYASRVS
mgnify:CR=1 FL=1